MGGDLSHTGPPNWKRNFENKTPVRFKVVLRTASSWAAQKLTSKRNDYEASGSCSTMSSPLPASSRPFGPEE